MGLPGGRECAGEESMGIRASERAHLSSQMRRGGQSAGGCPLEWRGGKEGEDMSR